MLRRLIGSKETQMKLFARSLRVLSRGRAAVLGVVLWGIVLQPMYHAAQGETSNVRPSLYERLGG